MERLTDPAKLKAQISYDAAADHYDDEPLGFWGRAGEGTAARVGLTPGMRVLDVCCGAGASALPAAGAVGPQGSVMAVDLAANLLELARRKAAAGGLANLELRQADMENLGYPDASFDAVICVFGIFFVADMVGLLRELWRMVKPGGKLGITTWGPDIFEPAYGQWREVIREVRPELYTAFNPWDRITDPDAVRRLFAEAGAAKVEIESEAGVQQLRSGRDWWTIAMGSGLRWTIDQLGADLAEDVRRRCVEYVDRNAVTSIETNFIYAIATKSQKVPGRLRGSRSSSP